MATQLHVVTVGETRLTDWARKNASILGKHYANELARRRNRIRSYKDCKYSHLFSKKQQYLKWHLNLALAGMNNESDYFPQGKAIKSTVDEHYLC